MAKKQLSEYTDEELSSQLKKAKMFYSIFIGLILAMVIISLLTIYFNKVSFNTYMPLFFLPLLFIFYNQVQTIKKEIVSRK